jgi:hypothetical protein
MRPMEESGCKQAVLILLPWESPLTLLLCFRYCPARKNRRPLLIGPCLLQIVLSRICCSLQIFLVNNLVVVKRCLLSQRQLA